MASRLGVALRSVRKFSSQAGAHEHKHSDKAWRNAFFIIGVPTVGLVWYNSFYVMPQHPERDEFVKYSHLRIRARPFPWGDGDRSLFHNEYYNALTDGYAEGSEKLHGGNH